MEKVKKKKKKHPMTLRSSAIVSAILLILSSFLVYYFSFDSQAHVLSCTGNYYLTDSQVYDLAQVDTNTRLWLVPSRLFSHRIKEMPLVDSVKIHKKQGKLQFEVKEKTVIGYYVKDNQNYMVTMDNEAIPIEEEYLKMIIHFPLLNGFSDDQIASICSEFKKHEKDLNRNVIEKIAEMVPYQTSFDDNMIKMTMQDGNVVYTNISSLIMMSKYQAMLTELHGNYVCLLLDASNSAIEKVNCDDLNSTTKDKEEEQKEKKTKKKKTDQSEEDTEPKETQEQQPTEQTEQEPEVDAEGWTYDESTGLYYNIYSGLYVDPSSGIQYVWNEMTQTFDVYTDTTDIYSGYEDYSQQGIYADPYATYDYYGQIDPYTGIYY